MSLSGTVQLFGSDIYTIGTTQLHDLGTIGSTTDGRQYRYAEAGGTDLSPGKLTVAATIVANHENISVQAAAAVGAESITVTLGATAATANDYANGFIGITDAAGEGIAYLVSGHPAADTSATLKLALKESVRVALTTSSEVSLLKNAWKDVVISVNDQGDMATGVPNVTISANNFGWVQTRGVCACLADETIAVGSAVSSGSSTGGAFETKDVDDAFPEYGYAIQAAVDEEYRLLYLTID